MEKIPYWQDIREIVTIVLEKRVTRSAAELAYFLILSFFPLLICVSSLVDISGVGESALYSLVAQIIPSQSLQVVDDYLGYISSNQSWGMFLGGLVLLVTSASGAFRSLMDTMDDIFQRQPRGGFWFTIMSGVLALLFLATIYGGLVLMVTGSWFLSLLEGLLGASGMLSSWLWVRFLVLFLLFFAMLLLLYRLVAPLDQPHPRVFPGTALAAFALVAVSVLFSFFMGLSSKYSLVYGSLASVIVLMVWLYFCGNIVIIGNVINFVLAKHRYRRRGD